MNPFSVSLESTRGGEPPHAHTVVMSKAHPAPALTGTGLGIRSSHPQAHSCLSPAPPGPSTFTPTGSQREGQTPVAALATAQESVGPHPTWSELGCQPAPAAPASLEVEEARAHCSLQLQLKMS